MGRAEVGRAEMTSDAVLDADRPALVVRVHVAVGEQVQAGAPLVTTETMKCETTLGAPSAGIVEHVVEEGTVVAPGDALVGLVACPSPAPPRPPRPPDVATVLAAATADGGSFVEHDLLTSPDGHDQLVPVCRQPGAHDAGVVVGVVAHPDGSGPLRRVLVIGDAGRALGAVAEPECRRVLAALDLAESHGWPLEWAAVSSGAVISLDSGTENMDWCAAVVARLVRFTQRGGEVVVVTIGPNVGAQSYWNAEATMLGHCRGILVMVDGSAMVLTGRRALALAGGATEATDLHLGGYDEVMGPNGEAHHHAPTADAAFDLARRHHRLGRARQTSDDPDRSVAEDPYEGPGDHSLIGEVLDVAHNPERKKPFAVRPLMRALVDRDADHLERWQHQDGAEGAVVWDTHVDGAPVTLVGIESHHRPADEDHHPRSGWSGGTLYPASSKKVARALNAASGRKPVVVLANLAGFDGSRWSLQHQQLEWGAEIARAVVNFCGPIVVVIIGRFHGGAYVVFNRQLNPELTMLALDGTRVSVIGGSAAADVVLRAEVRRVAAELDNSDDHSSSGNGNSTGGSSGDGDGTDLSRRARALVAGRFDLVHDVARAHRVGSVDAVIAAHRLRPEVVARLRPGSDTGQDHAPSATARR